MYYINYNNMKLSALGMGVLRMPEKDGMPDTVDMEKSQHIIDAAIASGVNIFDTSHIYQNGQSEALLGKALKEYPRDSYYLSSKFYVDYSQDIAKTFSEQLERCNTHYFDYYMLHGLDENNIVHYTDTEKNYLGFLLDQKKKGRIRNIGFSSHAAPETLERFLNFYDKFDMALIQLNYIDYRLLHAKEQYDLLTSRGIPVWVMEPLKGGRLSVLNEKASGILKGASPESSVSSWGFRYLMDMENVQVILSGMSSIEQVKDNAKTFAAPSPLSVREKNALAEASSAFIKDLNVPCSSCRYCCSSCPVGLNIPLLINAFNEWKISGETWKLADLQNVKGPDKCTGCGVCRGHCPQNIDIPAVMRELLGAATPDNS